MLAAAITLVASSATYAAVSTDQPDYAPGSTVTISGDNSDGAGYLPGNPVDVAVSGPNGWTASCTAMVSDAGTWSCQVTLSGDASVAVGSYGYTATSTDPDGGLISESGAFTDAAAANANFEASGLPAGTSVTVSWNGTNNGGGPVSGPTTFSAPGPSSNVGLGQGTILTCSFPASIVVGSDTYTLDAQPCGAGITMPTSSPPVPSTTVTGVYTLEAPTNVKPSLAWTANPSSANEGQTKTYSFAITDSDSTSWTFAAGYPTCGDKGTISGTPSIDNVAETGSFACTFPDGPSSSTVKAKVTDGTDPSNELTQAVTINNVSPTIAISGDANVDEGSTYTLTLGAVTDPGADTVTDYVVHWGDGNSSSYSSDGNKTHVYADGPNDYEITVDLTDEDGTFTDAANGLRVHVRNVAPAVNSVTVTNGSAVACLTGNTASLSFNFSDPGAIDDPWSYDIDWGDGFPHTTGNVSTQGDAGPFSHTYAAGTYTPSVRVTDKDGGTAVGSASRDAVSFLYDTSGVLQPVNNTQAHQDPSIFKYGSTIPVKIQVTDCDGIPVSGLSPKIAVKKVAGTTPLSGVDETISSTSGADLGTTMRWSDPLYIYNLATKSLTDSSATYQIIITGPFADVIAQFGTRAK